MKNQFTKTIVGVAMAAAMTISGATSSLPFTGADNNNSIVDSISFTQSMTVNAASGRLYYQYDKKWNEKIYSLTINKNRTDTGTLHDTGCGIFAAANAVYALNGKKMDIDAFANWALKNGWNPHSGTSRDVLYPRLTEAFGKTYGFKVVNNGVWAGVTNKQLIDHLKSGGVAVVHVYGETSIHAYNKNAYPYGHFIAMTGYDESTKKYHVIDSVGGKELYCGLQADSWVSASTLTSGNPTADWFCLISKDTSNDAVLSIIANDMLEVASAASTIAESLSTSNSKYFMKYTGTSTSIVTALNAVGVDSSYAYRQKIAAANGITGYSGTAVQNATMLNKLKAGSLKKPN